MKQQMIDSMNELVSKFEAERANKAADHQVSLVIAKQELRDITDWKAHLMPHAAMEHTLKAEQSDTLHHFLACVTAASATMLADVVNDSGAVPFDADPGAVDTTATQVDSLASYGVCKIANTDALLNKLATLQRYDMDQSDCDSCGQVCGANMVADECGDYLRREDVIRLLGGGTLKSTRK